MTVNNCSTGYLFISYLNNASLFHFLLNVETLFPLLSPAMIRHHDHDLERSKRKIKKKYVLFSHLRFPTIGMLFSLGRGGAATALAGRGADLAAGCGGEGAVTALAGHGADFAAGCGGGGAGGERGDRRLGVPELLREAGEEEEE